MVLKRITTTQVQIGMYIHAFEGKWLNHPFWRAHFLVNDTRRLNALRSSALDAVVIDTGRGIDLITDRSEAEGTAPATARPSAPAAPAVPMRPAPPSAATVRSGPVPIAREFGNARLTAGRARKVISRVFLEARLGKTPRVAEVAPVVEDIHASIQRNPYAFSGLMRCKAESEAAYQHMLSVSALMISLARQMRLPPAETRTAGMAGLLLDIGVSRLDIDLGAHSSQIDTIDPELWHRHCAIGRDTLQTAGGVPDEVLQTVMRHHERIDGSGFPLGLSGGEIDLYSRMAAVCDSYDYLVAGAVTGSDLDPATAMARMQAEEHGFDPEVLARFKEALGVYPVGSFVTLRSERVAMVVDQAPGDPTLPTVRAFYSLTSGKHLTARTIALSQCFGEDAIIGVADLAALALPPAEELRGQLFATLARTG